MPKIAKVFHMLVGVSYLTAAVFFAYAAGNHKTWAYVVATVIAVDAVATEYVLRRKFGPFGRAKKSCC